MDNAEKTILPLVGHTMNSSPKNIAAIFAFVAISVIIATVWIRSGFVLLGHDTSIYLYPWRYFSSFLYAWELHDGFGGSLSIQRGYLVNRLPELAGLVVLGNLHESEFLMVVFWQSLIFISMYLFVRDIFGKDRSIFFAVVASLVYGLNQYVLLGWFIAERAKFSMYIALPLMLLLLKKIHIDRALQWQFSALLAVLFFLLNGAGSPPLFGSVIVAFLVMMAVLVDYWIKKREWTSLGKAAIYTGATAGILVLLNAYIVVPLFEMSKNAYGSSVSALGGIDGLVSWERMISTNASILNLLRMRGIMDFGGNEPDMHGYAFLRSGFMDAVSFVPMVVILSGLGLFGLGKRSQKPKLMFLVLGLMLCAGLFFSGGSHPPFGFLYVLMMKYVPGFAIFRSSIHKFMPLVLLPISVLFAYYFDIFVGLVKSRLARTLVCLCMCAGIVGANYPFFTTGFFAYRDHFSNRVIVPPYIDAVRKYVAAHLTASDRILLVPEFDSGWIGSPIDTYTWGFYGYDSPAQMIADVPVMGNLVSDDWVTHAIYDNLYRGDSENFLRLTRKTGITHILWRADVLLSKDTEAGMTLASASSVLRQNPYLQEEYSSGQWTLFRVMNDPVYPAVYAGYDPVGIVGDAPKDALLMLDNEFGPYLRGYRPLPNQGLVVQSECVMCRNDEYDKLVASIILPAVNILPGSPVYTRVVQKEEAAISQAASKPDKVIDASLAFTMTRLAEYKALPQTDISRKKETEQKYRREISRIGTEFGKLDGRDAVMYAIRIRAYLAAESRELKNIPELSEVKKEVDGLYADRFAHIWLTDESTGLRGIAVIPETGEYRIFAPELLPGTYVDIGREIVLVGSRIRLESGIVPLEFPRTGYRGDLQGTAPVVFFVRDETVGPATPPKITVQRINKTLYAVDVHDAKPNLVIQFGQQFNRNWKAVVMESDSVIPIPTDKCIRYLDGVVSQCPQLDRFWDGHVADIMKGGGTRIPENLHFESNGYGNAWIINRGGNYRVYLFYQPQYDFNVGLAISALGVVSVLGLFLAMRLKRHDRTKTKK